MAHIDDLLDATSTKFHLTILAARRAREINAYYQQLGEGTGRLVPPLVVTESHKPLTIALEEIAQGKVVEAEPREVVSDDPLSFIGFDDEPGPSERLKVVEDVPDDDAEDDADSAE